MNSFRRSRICAFLGLQKHQADHGHERQKQRDGKYYLMMSFHLLQPRFDGSAVDGPIRPFQEKTERDKCEHGVKSKSGILIDIITQDHSHAQARQNR